MRKIASLILIYLFIIFLSGCGEEDEYVPGDRTWTIMFYGDADCNLEEYIMSDIAAMKANIADNQGVTLIVLIDRHPSYSTESSVFGENFSDTRLYRIKSSSYERLSGKTQFSSISSDGSTSYEANMGSASTLQKFINYCKENYPATDYALLISNHGGGPKKKSPSLVESGEVSGSDSTDSIVKSICWDETSSNDFLYTAEISDALTSDESVQLLGLDACYMSSVEFAYQFRNDSSNSGFSAEIMVSSAPTLYSDGFNYPGIFSNLRAKYYDPTWMTPDSFGYLIVETQRSATRYYSSQSLTCIDLSKVKAVKDAVDNLAVSLAGEKSNLETLRGQALTANLLNYFDESVSSDWVNYPFFDIYNLSCAIAGSSAVNATAKSYAATVREAVDAMVLYSFANSAYSGFVEGKSGVHIFFPDGDSTIGTNPNTHWYTQKWYNSIDLSSSGSYGKLTWCIDGATAGDSTVQNWFELLDSWYDTINDVTGGLNGYRW